MMDCLIRALDNGIHVEALDCESLFENTGAEPLLMGVSNVVSSSDVESALARQQALSVAGHPASPTWCLLCIVSAVLDTVKRGRSCLSVWLWL